MSSVTAPTDAAAYSGRAASADDSSKASTKRNFGRILEQTWIWSVVGYSVLRFVVAWGAFGEHGVNPWVFGVIDVGTAWPYGKGVALICKRIANSEWKRLPMPLAVALVCFFAPYAYIWFAAGEVPAGVRIGMAIFVAVLFVAATVGVVAKSRKLRREASEAIIEVDVREPAQAVVKLASTGYGDTPVIELSSESGSPELIIDLTDGAMNARRGAARR